MVAPAVTAPLVAFGAAAGELLLEPAREAARREAMLPANETPPVIPAQRGLDAGSVRAGPVGFEALDGLC
jgi:hypothetical protein